MNQTAQDRALNANTGEDHTRGGVPLQAQGVALKRGRTTTILHGVDLTVPAGAVLGLVGRNGAGKTSLMQCLVGLSVPQEGRCRLLGENALELSDAVKSRLGYVSQQPDLFDWLSADGHFRRFQDAYPNWDSNRAMALAARLGLPLYTVARSLSGGDQQKLSVVLALAHDPDLLILDEPVSSLDPITRRDFMRSLFERRWSTQGPRTILISSHLLSDLERVVSHVAFMRKGRIQLMDEWDALTEHLRLLELRAGHSALPAQAVHRRRVGEMERVVFDTRGADAPPAAGRALTLDELFLELNDEASA
jgi:ABC-2 type transport system ATP-binding protein